MSDTPKYHQPPGQPDPEKPSGQRGTQAGPDPAGFGQADESYGELGSAGQAEAGGDPLPDAEDQSATALARVAVLESQIADLTDRLLRAHAELENIRKRSEREKSDMAKYAISKFAEDIVGVTDNFQRALESVPPAVAEDDPNIKSLLEGVLMTERAFLQVLERHGVTSINPDGEMFNPHLHHAVMEQENKDVAAGMVLQALQTGYMIGDRVLRPAMVVVAKGGFKPVKTPDAAQGSERGSGSDPGGSAEHDSGAEGEGGSGPGV